MLTVFLSYSRSDLAAVQQLASDLHALGCTPWYDTELVGGDDWWAKILAQIREANVFLFALSTESLDSEACLAEFRYARELERRTIPALVADGVNSAALPRDLAALQQVDYRSRDKSASMSLARSLLNLVPDKPLPAELPSPPPRPLSYLGELREHVDAHTLDLQQQSVLLVRIKDLLRSGKGAEVTEIAKRLRKRRDLYAIVARDLEELLKPTPVQPSSARVRAVVASEPVAGPRPVKMSPQRSPEISYATLRGNHSDKNLMTALGITHDGARYKRGGESFYFLADAVNAAIHKDPGAAEALARLSRRSRR